MKTMKLLGLSLLLAATPLIAVESSAYTDEQIQKTALDTYNYRNILHDHVEIEVNDGVVELTGTVEEESLKSLAENTVRNIPGVVDVDNRIVVEPSPPERSDAWIALKVRTTLLVHAHVSLTKTDVEVVDGVVTLTGSVDSVAQKELTASYAQEVEGVKEIDNQLVVKETPVEKRTMGDAIDDASITARVKYELFTHHSTSALTTNVTTKHGMVTIEGEADNEAEKSLATRLAEGVEGVKSVSNNMTIKVKEPAGS